METENVELEDIGHATKDIVAIPSESLEDKVEIADPVLDELQPSPAAQDNTTTASTPEKNQHGDTEVNPPAQNDTRVVEKITDNTGKWKWIAFALVLLVGIASYFNVAKPPQSESTRVALDDILRHGTSLSMSITKMPKLEKVLQAAQKLGEISSRYQEQLTSAKSNLNDVRNARDKSLKAYQGCVIALVRYTPEQLSSAMGVIRKADLTPREKIVTELIEQHVNFLRTGNKADPEKFLLDFNQRFSNFAE